MSDFLGPLLGMSPITNHVRNGFMADLQTALAAQAQVADSSWLGALNAMAPPIPEPGIHWTRTGGKAWRVVIVR